MANEDDELDNDKELEESADDVESSEDDSKSKADLSPVDETPDKEVDDSEELADDLAGATSEPEEINAESDAIMPEESVVKSAPSKEASQLDRYKNFMDEYKKLQNQRSKSDLVAGLMAAGGKIGQSMAGKYSGQFNPDLTGVKLVQQMGERPVSDFEQGQVVQQRGMALQQQMAANDPASPMSEAYRNYFVQRVLPKDKDGKPDSSMFPNIDNYSASDVQNLLKTIGKPQQTKFQQLPMVNKKTGEKLEATFNPTTQAFESGGRPLDPQEWVRDYRAQSFVDPRTGERLGFNAGTGAVTGGLTGPGVSGPIVPEKKGDLTSQQPIQLNRSFLTAQQAKQVDTLRHQFVQEVKDDRNNLNSTDRVIAALEAGKELGDLPREEQDQLNRAFGQKGHISDAQIGVTLGKPDWKNRFTNAVSIGATGKLTDENRQFLLDTLKVIREQNQQYIDNKSQIYSNNLFNDLKTSPNLQKYKFGPDAARNLLGVEFARNPQIGGQVKQDPKIMQFAKDHYQGDYNKAKKTLVDRGYKPQEQ